MERASLVSYTKLMYPLGRRKIKFLLKKCSLCAWHCTYLISDPTQQQCLGRLYSSTSQIRKVQRGWFEHPSMQWKKCKRKLCLPGFLTVHLLPTAQMFENESPFSCYFIHPVFALEQVRSSGTRINLGRKISPFLFWELPLPHSTKIGLNTWVLPGPQTPKTGLVE